MREPVHKGIHKGIQKGIQKGIEKGLEKGGQLQRDLQDRLQKASGFQQPPLQRASFKIVIRRVERPFSNSMQSGLDYICQTLGFFEPIDKEKTAAAVFTEVVKATEKGEALTSTAIAERVDMSRGAVINHLNNLLRSGLIARHGRYYVARSKSIYRTITEIEEDIDRIFKQMKQTAKDIDKKFGLNV